MTQDDTHIHCQLLRDRMKLLHSGGMTYARMQQKSGVNQTTISRFVRGEQGLEPETYRKLHAALGKELPLVGTPDYPRQWTEPQHSPDHFTVTPSPVAGVKQSLVIECDSWHYDMQGNIVCSNASVLSGEIVG